MLSLFLTVKFVKMPANPQESFIATGFANLRRITQKSLVLLFFLKSVITARKEVTQSSTANVSRKSNKGWIER
jgi:hypothetical protein